VRYVAAKELDQTKDRSPANLERRSRYHPKPPKDPADEQTTADEQGASALHDREGIAAAVLGKTFATLVRFVASLPQAYILLTF
jgi:hypothetical protein